MTEAATESTAWSLRRRVPRLILAVMTLIAVLVVVVVVALLRVKHSGDEVVYRWDPAYFASQDALAAMVNQETGLRGYALSGSEDSLDPYTQFQQVEEDAVARLEGYLAGESDLLRDLAAYDEAVSAWRSEVAEPLIARVRDGDDTAADQVGSASAQASFDRIRTVSSELSTRIETAREAAQDDRLFAFTVVWVSIGLGVSLIYLSAGLLWRGLRRSVLAPIEDLAAQTRVVARGELGKAIVTGGPSEIVDLGLDADLMRGRLADQIHRLERTQLVLERRSAELSRSNDDLEQFAYVASHDLSEPLRKVTNFCQLLERQYADDLDDRARQYIDYVVDGAKRMQILISDLLSFSRVGRSTDHFEQVDLDTVLARVLRNLEERIAATGAEVVHDPLPTLSGDPTLLTALFQNLVGNAIKYHEPGRPPRVEVRAERDGDSWLFTVDDNGIGIDPEYAERIFTIFQRLHLRDAYGGTGIGLALCRKIVDFHAGRIWLGGKADPDAPGASFQFTLPVRQRSAEQENLEDHEPTQQRHA